LSLRAKNDRKETVFFEIKTPKQQNNNDKKKWLENSRPLEAETIWGVVRLA